MAHEKDRLAVDLATVRNAVDRTFRQQRLPSWIGGDVRDSWIEEAVTRCLELQATEQLHGQQLIKRATSVARQIVRREKHEVRHTETDDTGKKIRRSKAQMRIKHPVFGVDDEGERRWISPLEACGSDADGQFVGLVSDHGYRNHVEDRLIERLDRQAQARHLLRRMSLDDVRFVAGYIGRRRAGVPLSSADRVRFCRIRKQLG